MFIYREKDIKNMRDNLLFGKIQIFSPTISENIKAISNIEKLEKKEELSNEEKEILSDSKILIKTRDINPKIYSTELAKAQLYMNKFKHRTWNKILGELAVEAAFGSYLYQKDNGYSFNTFENFFNNEPNHPFNFMFAYVNADKMLYEDEDGKRFDYLPLIAIRKSVSRKYSSFFKHFLTKYSIRYLAMELLLVKKI